MPRLRLSRPSQKVNRKLTKWIGSYPSVGRALSAASGLRAGSHFMMFHDRYGLLPVGEHMATSAREKFATQVNSEILASVRDLAQSEGRQIQALVDEALADLIEKRRQGRPRASVMAAYNASLEPFGTLYDKLAK